MRRSKPREVILEELRQLKSHPRGDELFQRVRQRLPRVSLGTVYRNLDLFRRQGQVLEIFCGDFNRYDGNTSPHNHFLCRACRRLWDLDLEPAQPLEDKALGTELGFNLEGQYTVYYGLCRECQGQGEP